MSVITLGQHGNSLATATLLFHSDPDITQRHHIGDQMVVVKKWLSTDTKRKPKPKPKPECRPWVYNESRVHPRHAMPADAISKNKKQKVNPGNAEKSKKAIWPCP